MSYTKAFFQVTKQGKTVTYIDEETGNREIHIEGSRSWRNNNPGNTRGASGAIGRDNGKFDIFPDEKTGRTAKSKILRTKYGEYESIRQMLKGKFDKYGKYIMNTGYSPEADNNDPDAYAEHIKEWTKLDVDKKKLKDLTDDEWDKLIQAMKRQEGWIPGRIVMLDPKGNPISPNNLKHASLDKLHQNDPILEAEFNAFSDPTGRNRPFIYGKSMRSKHDEDGLLG